MGSLTVLAGFIRNRLSEGKACDVILHRRRVFFIPSTAWGATIPEVLVTLDSGASRLILPTTPLSATTFVAGGFPLTLASTLAKVFRVLSDNHTKTIQR